MRSNFINLVVVFFVVAGAASCGEDDETNTGGTATGTESGGETGATGSENPPLDLDSLTPGEWTFVPDDGIICMDGSTSGYGVRIKEGATKLLIHLQDGGACFNSTSCAGLVSNPNGFKEAELATWANNRGEAGIFNDASGPFADYSMVFVPYCGGDAHGGHNPNSTGGRKQLGFGNVTAMLDSVQPAFAVSTDKVVLSGASAGALGVLLNYEQTAEKFDETPVDMLSDSGQVLGNETLPACLQQIVRDAWTMNPSLPSDCTDCTDEDGGGLTNIYEYLADTYPQRKFALLTTDEDSTFRLFYGFGNNNCANPSIPNRMGKVEFSNGVLNWSSRMDGLDNMNIFVIKDSEEHVLTYSGIDSRVSEGVTVSDWLTSFETNDALWEDVIPAVTVR